jgi:hypothetical protein
MYLVYYITVNTTIITGYKWVYSDMFRLTRVIVRLSLEPLNISDNYTYFGSQNTYNVNEVWGRYLNVLRLWVVCLISMCLHLGLLCFQLRFLLPGAAVVAGCQAVSRDPRVAVCFCASLFPSYVSWIRPLDYNPNNYLQWSCRFCSQGVAC